MNKKIIIANWKMNPSSAEEALRLVKNLLAQRFPKNIELVIAPPFVYLDLIRKNLVKDVKLAAQNVGWVDRGAYTGEISAMMLKNLGCSYVIIGHSERRYKMGETDEMINLKLKIALKYGLTPILAVGEKEQNDDILKVLNQQIKDDLAGLGATEAGRVIFAYEPVWAISTNSVGLADTPDHALSATLLIRKIIGNIYTSDWASDIKVLYGGSVSGDNAYDFLSQNGINGALVGAASLDSSEFLKIIKSLENA